MSKPYQLAAVGGTFDHFHLGHEHLLDTAYHSAKQVVIGLTKKPLIDHKVLSEQIESYSQRKKSLLQFVAAKHPRQTTTITPLSDPFGPTLTDRLIDVLIVSRQTLPGVENLNQKRASLGLPQLPVVVTEMVTDDDGEYLSSTSIRRGLVSRQGRIYSHLFKHTLSLSPKTRKLLKSPQGELMIHPSINSESLLTYPKIALIGDQTTQIFIQKHLPFHYAVIDHRINRRPHVYDLSAFKPSVAFKAANQPGSIGSTAASAVFKLVAKPSGLLEIDGEEDLLGFPMLAALPLNSVIFYGQPQQGLVKIEVTEPNKNHLLSHLTGVDN